MSLNSEIEYWHSVLNTKEVLPEKALRRNVRVYPLVTYVNHTIALYLSGDTAGVALFVERAEYFMSENPDLEKDYFKKVQDYFSVLKAYLNKNHV